MNWLERLMGTATEPQADEQDFRRAALALLYEVARADGQVDAHEQHRLVTNLSQRWGVSEADREQVLEAIRSEAESATDLFDHTGLLREHWGPEQRTTLIEDMWQVASSDGELDPHEEQIIRRVADLLYVSHTDFIRGKMKTQADDNSA